MIYANLIREIWPDCDLPPAIVKELDRSLSSTRLTYEQVRAACVAHCMEDPFAQKNPKTPDLLRRVRNLKTEVATVKKSGSGDLENIKENLRKARESNEAAIEWLAPQIEGSSRSHLLALLASGSRFVANGEAFLIHALDSIGRRSTGKADSMDSHPDHLFVKLGRENVSEELVCSVQPARILASKAVREMGTV